MGVLTGLVRRIERMSVLDRLAEPLREAVVAAVAPTPVRNTLSGVDLGHPLHPMLSDVPIGAWLSAAVLDTVGGPTAAPAADLLVGVGILAALPTAASGLNDWSDTFGPDTRVGLAHALGNVVGLSLFTASWTARLAGRRPLGRALARAGMVGVFASAYLGGHLSFGRAVNVNHTAFTSGPQEWTPVADEAEVLDGAASVVVDAGGVPVLLLRRDGRLYALAATCTHAGGPLGEGTVAEGCVTCPWHGSTFRLADGSILRGPASSPQPTYDTRVNDGRLEVRLRS